MRPYMYPGSVWPTLVGHTLWHRGPGQDTGCTAWARRLQGCGRSIHPARKVREAYWKIYNNVYVGSQDGLVRAVAHLLARSLARSLALPFVRDCHLSVGRDHDADRTYMRARVWRRWRHTPHLRMKSTAPRARLLTPTSELSCSTRCNGGGGALVGLCDCCIAACQ